MQRKPDKSRKNKCWTGNQKDVVLVAAVLAAAVVSLLIYRGRNETENTGGVLEVTIGGELYGSFLLNEDMEETITTSYGSNTVVIEQGRVYVREADCPDKICARMPRISQDGEMICCLPHRLFLAVRADKDSGYDAIAY